VSDHTADSPAQQQAMFETEAVRSLLDQLLADSRLDTQSQDYKDLLVFVVRLRNFAAFNAMLLRVQKPGLSYATSGRDWHERFGRRPRAGSRLLLILWSFGPIALAYDVLGHRLRRLVKREPSMLTAYIKAALRKAHYEILPDGEGYFGTIEGLQGVWANADTLEACREELREVLEEWIVLGLKMGHVVV
jgi:predicted RNase H-like HicB family nuclease